MRVVIVYTSIYLCAFSFLYLFFTCVMAPGAMGVLIENKKTALSVSAAASGIVLPGIHFCFFKSQAMTLSKNSVPKTRQMTGFLLYSFL